MENNKIDVNVIYDYLEKLSLFELNRLNSVIHQMANDPERNDAVKRNIKIGMKLSYFHGKLNCMIEGEVIEVRKTKVKIKNITDNKIWLVSFRAINLDEANVFIKPKQLNGKLDKYTLRIGDRVGFESKDGQNEYGIVKKLNPKTAVVELVSGGIWHVYYQHLLLITEGVSVATDGCLLIEGEVVK